MGAAESVNVHAGDGRLLDALVSGPPDGIVLVFHTGTPVGLVPLPAGLDPAPMGIRTVLYARPGYGRSTPQAGRTVADAAGDTAAILVTSRNAIEDRRRGVEVGARGYIVKGEFDQGELLRTIRLLIG